MHRVLICLSVFAMHISAYTIADYINTIENFPHEGIKCYSIAPILSNPTMFAYMTQLFAQEAQCLHVDCIAGVDARGFIIGSALALYMKLPFVMIRKAGKVSGVTVKSLGTTHYGVTHTYELSADALSKGQRVLIVDDMLASGGTLSAAADLIKQLGAIPVGAACIIEFTAHQARSNLAFPIISLVQDEFAGNIRA